MKWPAWPDPDPRATDLARKKEPDLALVDRLRHGEGSSYRRGNRDTGAVQISVAETGNAAPRSRPRDAANDEQSHSSSEEGSRGPLARRG